MAVNLWAQSGKPTSYNPLTSGNVNYISIGNSDYQIQITARSASSATVKLDFDLSYSAVRWSDTGATGYRTFNLTPNKQVYTFNFTNNLFQHFYITDVNSAGNIIIDSIELVEKSTGVATINGIDGFLSGKWTLHANARVIDDETLELNATGAFQDNAFYLNVLPNMTYCFAVYKTERLYIDQLDKNDSFISYAVNANDFKGDFTTSFTTPSNCYRLKVTLTNTTTGTYTFKRPMLNLGNTPAPYEKKRGDRMVQGVVKKNIVNFTFSGGVLSGTPNPTIRGTNALTLNCSMTNDRYERVYTLKPNTNYTVSANHNGNVRVWGDQSDYWLVSDMTGSSSVTFNSGINTSMSLSFGWMTGVTTYDNVQLEEGTVATPYEPYAVQINQKSARRTSTGSGVLSAVRSVTSFTPKEAKR